MIRMNFNTIYQGGSANKMIAPIQMTAHQPKHFHSPNNSTKVDVVVERPSKKLPWGEPIWFLFHTLAHKIKEKSFLIVKNELLNIIFLICNNPVSYTHLTLPTSDLV